MKCDRCDGLGRVDTFTGQPSNNECDMSSICCKCDGSGQILPPKAQAALDAIVGTPWDDLTKEKKQERLQDLIFELAGQIPDDAWEELAAELPDYQLRNKDLNTLHERVQRWFLRLVSDQARMRLSALITGKKPGM